MEIIKTITKKDSNSIETIGAISKKKTDIEYTLPTLDVINRRINKFLSEHSEIASMEEVGKTRLGYSLNKISIGHGPKDLFIIGGTHSNEVIAVDTITQFLEHFDDNFDQSLLNEVTIHIIPIQNPEGYQVLDSLMTEIMNYTERNGIDLEEFCHDYYLNYRTDDLIYKSFKEMNKFMTDENFITHFREYITSNEVYGRLHAGNVLPGLNKEYPYLVGNDNDTVMLTFDKAILNVDPNLPLEEYLYEVRRIIMDTRNKLDENNKYDRALKIYLGMLFSSLDKPLTLINLNAITKLHQIQLEMVSFNAHTILKNRISEEVKDDPVLKVDFENSYLFTCSKQEVHTMMAQFASNIIDGVNLNGNSPYSPGINVIRNKEEVFDGRGSLSNIRNYSKNSPLGRSIPDETKAFGVIDESNIEFVNENKILLNVLGDSVDAGRYGGCILCHGTGGLLYYKPNEGLTMANYMNYMDTNESIVTDMQESIDETIKDLDPNRYAELMIKGSHYYRRMESADNTGFGDLLRSKYPRVIMFENSVMGGNPLGPYGDVENYARTVIVFSKAIEAASRNLSLSTGVKPTRYH